MNHMPLLALRAASSLAHTSNDTHDRPRIRANRQEVDDRFPVLGFTVDTRGLPWYEVILASSPAHFDPARAHERDASFYSSRADSGLISAESTLYTVPSAVLKRFASGRSIYYTLVAYADRQLGGAQPSHTLAELAHDAPRVQLAAGFSGRTLAAVLGVPAHLLQRVPPSLAEEAAASNAEDDRGEGEDGYGRASEAEGEGDWDVDSYAADEYGEPPYGVESGADSHDATEDEPTEGNEGAAAQAWSADEDYDDGFGGHAGAVAAGEPPYDYDELSGASDSSWPQGSPTPSMLEDHEQPGDDSHGPAEGAAYEDYSDGYGDSATPQAFDDGQAFDGGQAFDASEAYDAAPPAAPLDVPAQRRLLEGVLAVAGPPEGYATTLADAEFNGQFGEHPARGRYHLGLAFGIGLASQDRGDLGALLRLMQQRDPSMFKQVFGPHSGELIDTTNRTGPGAAQSPDGRGARVQPVGGEDLWSPKWLARFKESARPDLFGAGKPQLFNGAQNEHVVALYLHPMLPLARLLGLDTQRALGVLFDRALQIGVQRATDWVLSAISPIQTLAQRQKVLAALGHDSLVDFQRSQPGMLADGEWGPVTHAAVLRALRALGSASPLPMPQTTAEAVAALQRRAAGEPWQARLTRVLGALGDERYAF
ncbi:hypothetical protein LRS03_05320 [Rhizobacter sp. J219]|uniref:hypothetical protein n=1 Tax=Rhizobacter sp. J219 TaxID=2898430 RepID=UPI0021518293|nr:hypothetical protein [Rhizobacter sp. J219]MCR5882310.1 hypothetical protein [Rhizobacter sp. J219]